MHGFEHEDGLALREEQRTPRREQETDDPVVRRVAETRDGRALSSGSVMRLQRAAGNAGVSELLDEQPAAAAVHDVVGKGGGSPLPESTRSLMESRMGEDFSDVRVHTDAKATESAKAVQAHAYTVGNDVVVQSDRYSPDSADGQKMLAHELTHVVQQRSGPVDGTPVDGGVSISDPSDRFEQAAERNAEQVMAGGAAPAAAAGATGVQRSADDHAGHAHGPGGEELAVQGMFVQRQSAEDEKDPLEEDDESKALQSLSMQRAVDDEEDDDAI